MTALKTLLRRARTLLWTAFSIIVITAAVVVGVGELLMPYSERYQPRLEAWLSQEFGRPVELESFEGEWTPFGPRLTLRGMKLLPAEPAADRPDGGAGTEVAIESAALDIKPLNFLIPGRPRYSFRVIGADFELLHGSDGRLRLSGLGVSGRDAAGEGSGLQALARVGEVRLQDSSLQYQDEKYGVLIGFSDIEGRLRLEGSQLSAEVRASLFDARSGLVYGEIEATVLLSIDQEQKLSRLSWQATARELMLAALQRRLPANPFLPATGWLNAELWGDWSVAAGHSIRGAADLREARLINDHQDLWLERVNTRFSWEFTGPGEWQLHLADFLFDDGANSWTAPRLSMSRDIPAGLGLWISADELPLGVPLNLTRDVMSVYGTPWPRFLPRAATGQVSDLQLMLDDGWRLEYARARVSDGGVSDWDRWPDLEGLEGQISLRKGFGRLQFRGERVSAAWPRMFSETLRFSMPSCAVDIRWGQQWQVGFRDCTLENDDLAASAEVVITGDEGKPGVDVNVAVSRADIGRLDPYWPESVLRAPVKNWLRRGLRSGRLLSGRLQIRGDMDDWPFRSGEGRFEAVATVADTEIDYLEGWPAAGGVAAVARFVGASMDIQGTVADIGGLQSGPVRAGIADFRTPELRLDFRADSQVPGVLAFLQQTPLRERIEADLTQFTFTGGARASGLLRVPLGQGRADTGLSLDGTVRLEEATFYDPASETRLERISGVLDIDEQGFAGSGLEAAFKEYPARLDLSARADQDEKFRADLSGIFGVRDVIPSFLLETYADLVPVDGQCAWDVSLSVGPHGFAGDTIALLQVQSELQGMDIGLPAPMNKTKGASWPMVLRLPITGRDRMLDLEFPGRLGMRFDLPEDFGSPRRAVIRLGGAASGLPPPGHVRIEGATDYLDLDGWVDVIVEGTMKGKSMGGLELEGGSAEGTEVRGQFSSRSIDGSVRFNKGETGPGSLTAEFDRLVLGEPVSSGVYMESDPADLPALHLYAASFQYAGVELGETRIEAYPTATGFHFEKVDSDSEQLSVQATGDWLLEDGGQRSDFRISLTSESLGDFLQSVDISSSVEGGQTLVSFNAWWPGAPAAFSLSRLNGELEFSVVDGNISNADPGTGRLLGLLSFQALPRRLSLDFRDVFDTGFSFDTASGSFVLENGRATTDDVVLKASAASIMVSGSTDLVGRSYDQLLTIRPGVGNTLPIIGALAAGPGGAAAGLALQGLLHEQLGEATQVQYAISGPWDEPVFEAVDVKRAEPEPPEDDTGQEMISGKGSR
jgi:uncharacterized protein YhdP